MNDANDPLNRLGYSPEAAAEAAGVCRSRIFSAMKDGKLPARKYGRRTIILVDDLRAFLGNLPVREVA